MDFLVVICASLIWIIYIEREDSKRYYERKEEEKKEMELRRKIENEFRDRDRVSEKSISVSVEPSHWSTKKSVSADETSPAAGNFNDDAETGGAYD